MVANTSALSKRGWLVTPCLKDVQSCRIHQEEEGGGEGDVAVDGEGDADKPGLRKRPAAAAIGQDEEEGGKQKELPSDCNPESFISIPEIFDMPTGRIPGQPQSGSEVKRAQRE